MVLATVVTGTYGSADWIKLARTRTWPSVVAEGAPWVHVHGETLAEARNAALAKVDTEFVCVVDADDEISPGFLETLLGGRADIRVPSVAFVKNNRQRASYVPRVPGHDHSCEAACLADGNYIVCGAMVRTALVREIGGFREWPCYEDFDLWQRLWLAGATFETIPEAVYVGYWRADSRNRGPSMEEKNRVHWEITAANMPQAEAA